MPPTWQWVAISPRARDGPPRGQVTEIRTKKKDLHWPRSATQSTSWAATCAAWPKSVACRRCSGATRLTRRRRTRTWETCTVDRLLGKLEGDWQIKRQQSLTGAHALRCPGAAVRADGIDLDMMCRMELCYWSALGADLGAESERDAEARASFPGCCSDNFLSAWQNDACADRSRAGTWTKELLRDG